MIHPVGFEALITPLPTHTHPKGQELPVVVEVDGPTHHCVNEPGRMTGVSRLKHRLLAAQRHRWAAVVSVSLTEWEPLGFSARRKRAFVEGRLRGAGVKLEAYQFEGQDGRQACALVDAEEVCCTEVLLPSSSSSSVSSSTRARTKTVGRRRQMGGGDSRGSDA